MSQWQMQLQREYSEIMPFLSEEQQEYMNAEVAPLLDKAKWQIWAYNAAILDGEKPEYTEQEIRLLLRKASQKMLMVEVPNDG